MNKRYNNEKITSYLLGTLPEDEAEFFDELSFTDDEFAESLNAAEKDLVDAYINKELGGETLQKFESYYLASPIRREKVKFAEAFQGFAEEKIEESKDEIPQKSDSEKQGFFSNFFKFPNFAMRWGFAFAAILLLILGGWLFLKSSRQETDITHEQNLNREIEASAVENEVNRDISNRQNQNSEIERDLLKNSNERVKPEQNSNKPQIKPQPEVTPKQTPQIAPPKRQPLVATFILTPSLRGAGQLQNVSIPPNTDFVAMNLELETDDFPSYSVSLTDQSGKNLWRSGLLKTKGKSATKFLRLQFPAKLLKSQIYTLTVSGTSPTGSSEITGSYSFRVVTH